MTDAAALRMDDDACAHLDGGLTFDTASDLYGRLEPLLRERAIRKLDLTGVTSVDSAGLALLLELQATNPDNGSKLQIGNAPPELMRLAQLADAVGLLHISGRSPDR